VPVPFDIGLAQRFEQRLVPRHQSVFPQKGLNHLGDPALDLGQQGELLALDRPADMIGQPVEIAGESLQVNAVFCRSRLSR
jgi:hypothetical protein